MEAGELRKVLRAQRELYLRPDDKILFVVDESFKYTPIGEVFWGYQHDVVVIPQIERPGQDYELDETLLEGKTVGWLITSVSITHAPSTRKMFDQGVFVISNPGITPDWLSVLDPINRKPCQENAAIILTAIGGDIGGEIHVLTEDGTNLLLMVPNGNWKTEVGIREGIGTNGLYGELVTAPYWAEGTYVLKPDDFLTNPINEVQEKIRLTVANNQVVEIKGGAQAETLRKILQDTDDPRAYTLGEFSFGINPGWPKKVCQSVVAEKLTGGIHIALGTNAVCLREECPEIQKFQYGRYNACVHIDCIKFLPTVVFRSKGKEVKILEKGVLAV